ncbi:MAG: transposase [Burkholderiaceae bacterium]|nr:transposase [Burkholderiaceae bacterium]
MWIDATYVKIRQVDRIGSEPVIFAVGVNTEGHREVLGLKVSASEAGTLLDGVFVLPQLSWAAWGQAAHQRQPRRHQGCRLQSPQTHLAMQPGALHAQRPGARGKDAAAHGLCGSWNRIRAGLTSGGQSPVEIGGRSTVRQIPQAQCTNGRGRNRVSGVCEVSKGTLVSDIF